MPIMKTATQKLSIVIRLTPFQQGYVATRLYLTALLKHISVIVLYSGFLVLEL